MDYILNHFLTQLYLNLLNFHFLYINLIMLTFKVSMLLFEKTSKAKSSSTFFNKAGLLNIASKRFFLLIM